MEEFLCRTKIISGAGAVAFLSDLRPKRLFLVTDPFFQKNGTAKRIANLSKAAEVAYFDKIQPDPTVELAAIITPAENPSIRFSTFTRGDVKKTTVAAPSAVTNQVPSVATKAIKTKESISHLLSPV